MPSWLANWHRGVRFVRGVAQFRPRMLAALVAAMVFIGLTESLTFATLIPLLSSIGGPAAAGTGGLASDASHIGRLAVSSGHPVTLEAALAMFLAAMLARSAGGLVAAKLSARYVAAFRDHMRRRLYMALSRASWLYLTTARHARDTHALTALADNVGDGLIYLIMLATSLVVAMAGVATAMVVAPKLAAGVVIGSIAIGAPLGWLLGSAYEKGAARIRAMDALYEALNSRAGAIKLAKAFAIERQLESDFAQVSEQCRLATASVEEDLAQSKFVQDGAAAVAIVAFAFLAVRISTVSSIELILLVTIAARLLPVVTNVRMSARGLMSVLPAFDDLLDRERQALAAGEPVAPSAERIEATSAIELRGVSFAYVGTPKVPVLSDVSVRLRARTAFAIVGVSGAGKSTLADILAGLIVPDSGSLAVDGRVIDADLRPLWRNGIAYVPQDAPLFDDSVRANLVIGARDATEAEIWTALELVGAAGLVRGLEQGLDTRVGERGVRLSGGQRQRLRLASALMKKPVLLILDEATNALSPADEKVIFAGLRSLSGEMTIVVIAHRRSSIEWTDDAVLIAGGRIAAAGTPDAVMAAGADVLEFGAAL